jgi:hypothetical protein
MNVYMQVIEKMQQVGCRHVAHAAHHPNGHLGNQTKQKMTCW